MGTEKMRKQIVGVLLSSIRAANEQKLGVSRKKLEAQICINYGFTLKKAREYTDLLIDAEVIIEDNGELWDRSFELDRSPTEGQKE